MEESLPIDVADVEDFTKTAGNLGIGTYKFRTNASLSQVGTHGEVSNTSDHGDRSGDVVEEPMGARLSEGKAHECNGGGEHHGADRLGSISLRYIEAAKQWFFAYPVPIRSMGGDGNIRGGTVDHVVTIGVNSIVTAALEEALACHLEICLQLKMWWCGGKGD